MGKLFIMNGVLKECLSIINFVNCQKWQDWGNIFEYHFWDEDFQKKHYHLKRHNIEGQEGGKHIFVINSYVHNDLSDGDE